jgi:hypothetical protein
MKKSVKEARAGLIPSEEGYLETHDWNGELPRRCTRCGATETEALDTACPSKQAENLPVVTLRVKHREYDTVLAALRFWQAHGSQPCGTGLPLDQENALQEIADEHGTALSGDEIDELIERVQFDDKSEPAPIIVVEGGVVQNVFYPVPDGTGEPISPAAHDLFDYDIFDGGDDATIVGHWNQLSDEAKAYFKKHVPEAWEPVRKAIAREKRRARKVAKKIK